MKMGEIIEGIREEIAPKGMFSRFLDKLKGLAAPIAWRLWGRRRAIRRMRELAGVGATPWSRPLLESEEDRLARHREHLDSIRVPLPTPDSNEV